MFISVRLLSQKPNNLKTLANSFSRTPLCLGTIFAFIRVIWIIQRIQLQPTFSSDYFACHVLSIVLKFKKTVLGRWTMYWWPAAFWSRFVWELYIVGEGDLLVLKLWNTLDKDGTIEKLFVDSIHYIQAPPCDLHMNGHTFEGLWSCKQLDENLSFLRKKNKIEKQRWWVINMAVCQLWWLCLPTVIALRKMPTEKEFRLPVASGQVLLPSPFWWEVTRASACTSRFIFSIVVLLDVISAKICSSFGSMSTNFYSNMPNCERDCNMKMKCGVSFFLDVWDVWFKNKKAITSHFKANSKIIGTWIIIITFGLMWECIMKSIEFPSWCLNQEKVSAVRHHPLFFSFSFRKMIDYLFFLRSK